MLLSLLAASCALHAAPLTLDASASAAPAPALAERFALPAPTLSAPPLRLWSTHYVLHRGAEVAADQGPALLGVGEQPFPAEAPIHLSERDWCYAALEGSAAITRLDGSVLTVNYAGTGPVAVDCGPPLGNARWRTQGTVRFAAAVGPYGDGVQGYALVPFRTVAVDPARIPIGSLLFIPDAVGVPFTHEGEDYTHDGYFFAADVGGAIRGAHIDTFTGTQGSPFPHVGDRPQATFDAYLIGGPSDIRAALEAAHQP